MSIKAVLFDLYGTIAHVRNSETDQEASDYLVSRGDEVSLQTFMAVWRTKQYYTKAK